MTLEHRQKRIRILIYAGIAAITIAAYEPIRNNSFIGLDDPTYITDNPNVNSGITVDSVIGAFTKTYAANWHPLTWLSHMLDCEIYGLNPLGHHITSLLIHIAGSVLLFRVLSRMTRATWASAFVAAMFAVHPVHVESVAWAAERKDVLSGLFWILTMLAYVHYTERPNLKRYALVLLAFVMGIMSKPMVVTLPFVLLLLDYWPLERFRRQKTEEAFQKASIGRLILEKTPLFALSAVSSVITFIAQKSGGAVIALEKIPLNYRIANMFVSYIRYIGKTIWPSRLAVLYPHPHIHPSEATAVICVILFVLITILSIDIGRRRKYAAVGWLWYAGTLVPVVGLIQVGSQGIANRYMYIPMIGLFIIAAWGIKDLIGNRRRYRIVAAVSAAAVLLSAVALTRIQVGHWQNNITLFGYATKVTEDNSRAETNYGIALAAAGRLDEAVLHLTSAIRKDPTNPEASNYLGKVFLNQGKYDEAIECFNELIELQPDSAEAYYNLGMALGMQGKNDDAIQCFSRTIALDPKFPDIYKRMGMALLAAGRMNEAIDYLKEALRTSPDEAVTYVSISIAYIKSGNYDLAIENWNRAKELKPEGAGILKNPGWLLVTARDVSTGDANKVIEFAERACEMTRYNDIDLLDTLAASYAAAGRFEKAIKTAEKAIDIAKTGGHNKLAGNIEKRMELYRAGKRYIQK
ncbi:MAG: tetratricopeptide repeat protein [Planctomycetota bacterium]